jgi:dCMP deaminase
MSVAELFAMRSTCSRAHVGVVIARDGRILTTGYNGAPRGMEHCSHTGSEDPCTVSVHAEANAISYAGRFGITLDNSELYSTYLPCLSCAQLIINVGINKIFVKHMYRDRAGQQLLKDAGIDIIIL